MLYTQEKARSVETKQACCYCIMAAYLPRKIMMTDTSAGDTPLMRAA